MSEVAVQTSELWSSLRQRTQARIGLGRAGSALPTRHRLELQAAHAAARDAVHSPFEPDVIAAGLAGTPTVRVRSSAPDRLTYLQRPDLGRRLDPLDRAHLPAGEWDAVFVVADGLSSRAVHEHAAAVVRETAARLEGLAPRSRRPGRTGPRGPRRRRRAGDGRRDGRRPGR